MENKNSALLSLYAGNSPVTGEILTQRPVTRNFDVFFDLRLNKGLSKQSRRRWFETPSHPLLRHCNECYGNCPERSGGQRGQWLQRTFARILTRFHNGNSYIDNTFDLFSTPMQVWTQPFTEDACHIVSARLVGAFWHGIPLIILKHLHYVYW